MYFIPDYALNNLANMIGISLSYIEEECDHTINEMPRRKPDRVTSRLNPKGCSKLVAHKFHYEQLWIAPCYVGERADIWFLWVDF